MKRTLLASVFGLSSAIGAHAASHASAQATGSPPSNAVEVDARSKPIIEVDGHRFRDLDANGALTPYEDWRLSAEERVGDLISRMTLLEKAGTMMHPTLSQREGATGPEYDLDAVRATIMDKRVNHLLTRLAVAPGRMAEQSNAVQALAEETRLGIPLTISTDPRSHFQDAIYTETTAPGFSQWPETLGLAALRDTETTRRFGEIVRQEYRSVGIHEALSPQVDLATEPRWARTTGTFGSSPDVSYALGRAYVAGFQGGEDGLTPDGVLTVAKHFVGYGAAENGFDAHNYYGRFADLGEGEIAAHMRAFQGTLDAKTGGVMPAYAILRDVAINGKTIEEVGPGFSETLLLDVLRGDLGYEGIILSDWGITRDCDARCRNPTEDAPQRGGGEAAKSWGVIDLSVQERFVLGLEAGLDQFGGVDDVERIVDAVESGAVDEARIDASVRRLLLPKFTMGLFDDPYVDSAAAEETVGNEAFVRAAHSAQRDAQVLLQNRGGVLPFRDARTVYLHEVDPAAAEAAGLTVVDDARDADVAVIRAETPSEVLHPYYYFGSQQKEGRLDFREGDAAYDQLRRIPDETRTVLAVFLDRPAILTGVTEEADVILANFGASDAAILDVITGAATAKGRMPFELPSSMKAVRAQRSGRPDDSENPLFAFGAGIEASE